MEGINLSTMRRRIGEVFLFFGPTSIGLAYLSYELILEGRALQSYLILVIWSLALPVLSTIILAPTLAPEEKRR